MVGKAEAFLKKKKLLEFYREASKIRAFFYEKRRERHRKQTGDDLAVMEWMIYLLAKAPLLPDDEWVIPVMKNAPGPSPRFFR